MAWGENDVEAIIANSYGDNEEAVADLSGNSKEGIKHDASNESLEESSTSSNEGRTRRPPIWMRDYESGEGLSSEEDIAHLAMFANSDPTSYVDAVKSAKWRKAMDLEIEAI